MLRLGPSEEGSKQLWLSAVAHRPKRIDGKVSIAEAGGKSMYGMVCVSDSAACKWTGALDALLIRHRSGPRCVLLLNTTERSRFCYAREVR